MTCLFIQILRQRAARQIDGAGNITEQPQLRALSRPSNTDGRCGQTSNFAGGKS